jgi:hypothetical protein
MSEQKQEKVERYFVQIREYLGGGKYGDGISKYLDKEDATEIYKILLEKKRYSEKYGKLFKNRRLRKLEL